MIQTAGKLGKRFHDLLSSRSQRVTVNYALFDEEPFYNGVFQRNVLEFLLFVVILSNFTSLAVNFSHWLCL